MSVTLVTEKGILRYVKVEYNGMYVGQIECKGMASVFRVAPDAALDLDFIRVLAMLMEDQCKSK